MDKSSLLAMLGPDIKRIAREVMADVQGDMRVAGDALVTGRMSATEYAMDGREVELGWVKDKWVWYYGSASTILIYGPDVSDILTIGTKLRWQQGGGWLYAKITNVVYASGATTLTVLGDTVSNAAITDNYFSYQDNPPGWISSDDVSVLIPALAVDNSNDTFNPGDTSYHDITGWSVSFTVPSGSPDVAIEVGCVAYFNTIYGAHLRLRRDTTTLAIFYNWLYGYQSGMQAGFSLTYINSAVAAGSYTYKVSLAGAGSVSPDIDIVTKYIKVYLLNT